jgi:hypothetical protein
MFVRETRVCPRIPSSGHSTCTEGVKGRDYAVSRRRFREATARSRAALNLFSDSCCSFGVIPLAPSSMMSRMVPRSVSIADLPFMEVGTADAFLRFAVAMTGILPRRAGSAQVTDVLLPLFRCPKQYSSQYLQRRGCSARELERILQIQQPRVSELMRGKLST